MKKFKLFRLLFLSVIAGTILVSPAITATLTSSEATPDPSQIIADRAYHVVKFAIDNQTLHDFTPVVDSMKGTPIKPQERRSAELPFAKEVPLTIINLQPNSLSPEVSVIKPIYIIMVNNDLKIMGCDSASPFICEGTYNRIIENDGLSSNVEVVITIKDKSTLPEDQPSPPNTKDSPMVEAPNRTDDDFLRSILSDVSKDVEKLNESLTDPNVPTLLSLFK